jgi:hypothetical protein
MLTMSSIDTADRFLAECVRCSLASASLPTWPDSWNDPEDAALLAARAEFHGIALLLAPQLGSALDWPAPLREQLLSEARLAGLWEEMHRAAITRLIASLADAGIAALVMKGTALAYLYHTDPAMRRRGDTDLLIHPDDLARTRAILAANRCFKREDPHGLFFQETWEIECGAGMIHSLDLHWEPADRPVLQQVLRSEEYWARRIPVPRLGPHAFAPEPVLMLVHGAINQAWHVARGFFVDGERIKGGRRLIWSVDYALLAAGFSDDDWQRLVTFCKERRVAPLVLAALKGAQEDVGLALPDAVLAELVGDPQPSPAAAYIAAPDRLGDMWADIRGANTLRLKAQILASMVFAPRSHLEDKFPHLAHWPTLALQLRRYAGAVGWLRQRSHSR